MKAFMSIYNKENSIGIMKNMPLSSQKDSATQPDMIYQALKANTDSAHTIKNDDFEVFEVSTTLLNPRSVSNRLRTILSVLRKKADVLEIIIHG
ncbi:MAG: hypothetical protein RLO12_21425 [Fulvivirga sp.]